MLKFIRQRLQVKLILAFLLVLLIPTVAIGAYTNSVITKTTLDGARADKLRAAELQAGDAEKVLLNGENNTLFYSRTPITRRLIEALGNKADTTSSQASVTSFFEAFLNKSNDYKEISVVDPNGQPLVDIERNGDQASPLPASEIENESQVSFFTQAVDLASGQVYVSGLVLDQLHGKVMVPYVPLINFSTPLFASNGNLVGVLILEGKLDPILSAVVTNTPGEITYLLDSDGSYLYHPETSKLYGHLLNTDANFYKDEPNDSGPILAQSQAEGILLGSTDQPNMMETFIRITPTGQDSIQWTLVHLVPLSSILQNVYEAQKVILFVALSALLIAIALALFFTRGIARPVRQLADVAGSLSQGHWEVPIPVVKSGDEISDLASAFDTMSKELQALYYNLEARVAARTAELEVANKLAHESSRLKSEFMANMSHELRTPLNAMIGFSGILLQGMGGEIDDDARHMIERMDSNANRLLKLINDVLDIAKIEAGRLEIVSAPFAPRKLVQTWQAQMSVLAEQRGVKFEVNIDPALPEELYGDSERLAQIVINLLSNAFKFTKEGSVTLNMKPNGNEWNIQVVDTGIGIPPHAINYIFDEFRQVDGSSTRSYGGTGLGLAIARNLCQMMGGTIVVSSTLGQGSTFTVTLPLKPVMQAEAAKVASVA